MKGQMSTGMSSEGAPPVQLTEVLSRILIVPMSNCLSSVPRCCSHSALGLSGTQMRALCAEPWTGAAGAQDGPHGQRRSHTACSATSACRLTACAWPAWPLGSVRRLCRTQARATPRGCAAAWTARGRLRRGDSARTSPTPAGAPWRWHAARWRPVLCRALSLRSCASAWAR